MTTPPPNSVHAETAQAWRAWLQENFARDEGVWLISWKKAAGRPAMSYDEMVAEALCFGWVDSKPAKLDDLRSMLYFAPRKGGSGWSKPNKVRIARMMAAGKMHPAGTAKVEAAKADGTWVLLDEVEALALPADLAEALHVRPPARANWDAFPRSVKRGVLEWIIQARKPETRARRVLDTAERAQRNERANQWRKPPAT